MKKSALYRETMRLLKENTSLYNPDTDDRIPKATKLSILAGVVILLFLIFY